MDATAQMMLGVSYLQKELELKQNLVGEGFARPPSEGRIRVNIIGEITRAERFAADKIYLNYELDKPNYWRFDNEDEEDYAHEPPELRNELNRLASTTNVATPNVIYESGETIPVFHYSFPIDWQFLIDEDLLMDKWPKIIIQVNSLDTWGRYRVEGYGFVEIPRYCGLHKIEVKTWKPYETQESKNFSFFLGGSIRVKEPKDIAKTSHRLDYDENAILNRFSTTSESAGSVFLTLNVIKQTETVMQERRKEFRDTKHKERLQEYRQQSDATHYASRTDGFGPSMMKTDLGGITRFAESRP